jgi:hypothetical protein
MTAQPELNIRVVDQAEAETADAVLSAERLVRI